MTLTLFEHETIPFDWNDRDLAAIERLNARLGTEVLRPTVLGTRRAIRAAQHVGVLRLGRRTVQILPKIYRSGDAAPSETRAREATANLLHMLEYAAGLPVRRSAVAPLLERDADWFEVLTRLFAAELTEQWQRGPYRTYQTVEDDLPVLKGKWRIPQQLRRPGRDHRFAVAYDEFTADNSLNRVFRFVVERLWSLTRDAGNRRVLGELRQWMDEVTLLGTVMPVEADPSQLSRLNARYGPLLTLARLFLSNASLQLIGGGTQAFAFVLDMNRLFEGFVAAFIRGELAGVWRGLGWTIRMQSGKRELLRDNSDRPHIWLRPDLRFETSDGSAVLLVDTKYKLLDRGLPRFGMAEGDAYQMFAYARRYNCARVVLLYPTTGERLGAEFRTDTDQPWLLLRTLPMGVDLGKSDDRDRVMRELIAALTEETHSS